MGPICVFGSENLITAIALISGDVIHEMRNGNSRGGKNRRRQAVYPLVSVGCGEGQNSR